MSQASQREAKKRRIFLSPFFRFSCLTLTRFPFPFPYEAITVVLAMTPHKIITNKQKKRTDCIDIAKTIMNNNIINHHHHNHNHNHIIATSHSAIKHDYNVTLTILFLPSSSSSSSSSSSLSYLDFYYLTSVFYFVSVCLYLSIYLSIHLSI